MSETSTLPELLADAFRRGAPGDPCPELDRLAAVAAGEAAAGERAALLAHAAGCAACAAELDLATRLGVAERSPASLVPDAAAARIEARLATGDWRRGRSASRLSLAPAVAAPQPADQRWRPRPATRRAQWRAAALVLALAGSAGAWWFAARPPALPEPATDPIRRGAALRLDGPLGNLAEPPTRFVWAAVNGAAVYELRFFAVDGRALGVERVPATETSAEVVTFELGDRDAALGAPRFAPGVRYEWQVYALGRDGAVLASSPRSSFRSRPGTAP